MLLTSAGVAALWALYDATGIRPEWIAPVLYYESGFDPSLPNRQGAPYYGIGQSSHTIVEGLGVTPSEFLTWSQEEQIRRAVLPYFAGLVHMFGPLRSGARVYQANYQPATLPTVRKLWQVVAWRGSQAYEANRTLDQLRDGAITLSDLALAVQRKAQEPEVIEALAEAYEQRPDEKPTSPAFGADYTDPRWWVLAPVAVGAYAGGR